MQHQRTQVYLVPSQHAALLEEARKLGVSLAGLIRKLVDEHFARRREDSSTPESRRAAAFSIIGLGNSGPRDVSENVDRYLAEAIYDDVVKERRGGYKKRRRPK